MRNSKHETIADVVAKMLEFAETDSQTIGRDVLRRRIQHFANRIEAAAKREREAGADAAHKREVAELRECLKEAVTEVCNRLEKCGFKEPCVFKTCYVQRWRKALKDEGGAK